MKIALTECDRTVEVVPSGNSVSLAVRDADNKGPVVSMTRAEVKALVAGINEYLSVK
jgi:hypothetical protein